MVSPGSTKDHGRNLNGEVYYAQVLEEVQAHLRGSHGEVNARCRQKQYRT